MHNRYLAFLIYLDFLDLQTLDAIEEIGKPRLVLSHRQILPTEERLRWIWID